MMRLVVFLLAIVAAVDHQRSRFLLFSFIGCFSCATCVQVIAQEFEDAFEVTGSDISAMNGIYIRTDDWDGHSLYTNQGLTAVLYFRSSLGDRGAWFVGCSLLLARYFSTLRMYCGKIWCSSCAFVVMVNAGW